MESLGSASISAASSSTARLIRFVDDHPEVHAAIRGAVAHQYFFGAQVAGIPGYGIRAPAWADAEAVITSSFRMLSQ